MKALKCEMCNSSDFVKDGGFFVCQSCGTKYTVEDAKKLMIEGTVNIQGTVTIDNSGSYDKIVELGREAFGDCRYETAYDYFCQAVEIKPNDPESIMYQGLCILGNNGVTTNSIATSCKKRVEKSLELFQKTNDNNIQEDIVVELIKNLRILDNDITSRGWDVRDNLDSKKMKERSAFSKFSDLGENVFVAAQNQANDRIIESHNNAIQADQETIRNRQVKIHDYIYDIRKSLFALCNTPNARFEIAAFEYGEIGRKVSSVSDIITNFPALTMSKDKIKYIIDKSAIIYNAADKADVQILKMMIEAGGDVNKKAGFKNASPIYTLGREGKPLRNGYVSKENEQKIIESMELLLSHGAIIDINETPYDNATIIQNTVGTSLQQVILKYKPELQDLYSQATPLKPNKSKKTGCYVATCVYGSYDCPQVWTLRRFRDFTLAKTWFGRTFIRVYYTVSPTIVKLFGHKKWFTKFWKSILDNLIAKLNEEGIKNSSYDDIDW